MAIRTGVNPVVLGASVAPGCQCLLLGQFPPNYSNDFSAPSYEEITVHISTIFSNKTKYSIILNTKYLFLRRSVFLLL